jgi:hypothetical protein
MRRNEKMLELDPADKRIWQQIFECCKRIRQTQGTNGKKGVKFPSRKKPSLQDRGSKFSSISNVQKNPKKGNLELAMTKLN